MESSQNPSRVGDQPTHSIEKGATFWFTGLSGAGKSSLSQAVKA
jgi:adenylylsulfate kinase